MDTSDLDQLSQKQEILYLLFDAFVRDFTISDVKNELVPDIFTRDEYDMIISSKDEIYQIEKMFFILLYTSKSIFGFIKALSIQYYWLSEQIREALQGTIDYGSLYMRRLRALRDETPKHFDSNVHRTELLWTLQSKLKSLIRGQYLVIHGNLLFGKRWLSLDACSNYLVMQRMGFQIFWLNLSKCETEVEILMKLERLLILLDDKDGINLRNYDNISNKIFALKDHLNKILDRKEYKDCLLVLANVKKNHTLKAFSLYCKTLIITRNKELINKLPRLNTQTLQITKGFTQNESLELFSKVLGMPIKSLPPETSDIHVLCGGSPFIISLIAGNVKEYSNTEYRLKSWKNNVKTSELINVEELREYIERSTDVLSDEYKQLFHSLVIFTDNVNIPVSLLQLYWKKNEKEVEAIINKLDKLYLVEVSFVKNRHSKDPNSNTMVCLLQYHYYSYLNSLISKSEKEKMHESLVNCYDIPQAIQHRTEPNIIQLPHDGYFHFYIGYHLKNANMIDVFPKLFLDFGFLEQKLRATGLPNTLGDLRLYQKEITGDNKQKIQFFEQLLQFLPNVEELIMKSADTCLLQYALTTYGILQSEALKLVKQFSDRIWFTDRDHTHKHRQIVSLPQNINIIRFVEPDTALIAFIDNSILLTDLSTFYTVEPTMYIGHKEKIKDIHIFQQNYFISLDIDGVCKVWSFKNTPLIRRRSTLQFPPTNGHTNARRTRSDTLAHVVREKCIQTLDNGCDRILCFSWFHNDSEYYLLAGTNDGNVLFLKWNAIRSKFEMVQSLCFRTKMPRIHLLLHISPILLAIDNSGKLHFYNLKNQAQMAYNSPWKPEPNPIALHLIRSGTVVAVFKHKIIQIVYDVLEDIVMTEFTEIYSTSICKNKIICSAVSDDGKYLVLGTKKGVIVFDPVQRIEILTNNVSETVNCLALCSLDDNSSYKYVLLSATTQAGPAIIINGLELRRTDHIQWASNRMGSPINDENICLQEMLNGRLLGKNLFTVTYWNQPNETILTAVDSKWQIYQKFLDDTLGEVLATRSMNSPVTTITSNSMCTFIGCENGFVYDLIKEQPYIMFDDPVEYLECFRNDLVVGSTIKKCKIRYGNRDIQFDCDLILKSFMIGSFLILVKCNCLFEVFDIKSEKLLDIDIPYDTLNAGGCDYQNGCLVIGAKLGNVYLWKVSIENEQFEATLLPHVIMSAESKISCIKISENKEFLAIGFECGVIDLYTLQSMRLLLHLRSHKSPISDMVFSPWTSTTVAPIILVSLSEQICFWNVSYVLNNPSDSMNRPRKSSQRFSKYSVNFNINKSPIKSSSEEDMCNNNTNIPTIHQLKDDRNLWIGKLGSSDKPELLSCIKLVGNSAKRMYANEDFTQFTTIDDEGEIYNIKLLNLDKSDDGDK